MKNVLYTAIIATLISACSSTPDETAITECTFPDSPTAEAPLWVCNAPVEGIDVSAIGTAPLGKAGLSFAKQQAATAARVELAQSVHVEITNMIKQYAETTGIGDEETVDQVMTSVTKQITSQELAGTKIIRTATSPGEVLYVMVGIDPATANQITETAIQTSMNKEAALWQKFQADKAQEELAKEIAAMRAR